MLQLHPEPLTKNGQDFVILPYSEHNWENALEKLKIETPENQAEKIKKLFHSWDQFNDEQAQQETLEIIQSLEKIAI